MSQVPIHHAVILFGHGSRDPLWHRPIEAVAAAMRQRQPEIPVRCAYLELSTPDLATVVAELAALGAKHLHIVPMFLGVGRHAREDLPLQADQLRQRYPALQIELAPAVGEDARLIALLAEIALSGASTGTH